MRQFSRPRLLLSRLIAGMVIDSIQYLLDSFVFSDNWDATAKLISPAAPPAFTLTATKILALMQLIGLAARMLAVRFGALHSRHKSVSAATHPPLKLVNGISFALSGLVGSWAGAWLGKWVYRESEQVAAERPVQA